ncbi:hypothetical protein D3C81_1517570 [compost metagenome]
MADDLRQQPRPGHVHRGGRNAELAGDTAGQVLAEAGTELVGLQYVVAGRLADPGGEQIVQAGIAKAFSQTGKATVGGIKDGIDKQAHEAACVVAQVKAAGRFADQGLEHKRLQANGLDRAAFDR